MAEIRITLRSDLAAASGAAFGNAVDTDVALDASGIPYIPARRIKGCLRQAAEDLRDWGCAAARQEAIDRLFGGSDGQEGALRIENAVLPRLEAIQAAIRAAKNDPALQAAAAPSRVSGLFTYVRGSTAMQRGKAKDGTLRFTRVVDRYSRLQPGQETVFSCPVNLVDSSCEELLKLCCQATRQIGYNRNRGLGAVHLEYVPSREPQEARAEAAKDLPESRYRVEYSLSLREPVAVPGLEDRIASVSSRAVIGCLSEAWLKNHSAREEGFKRLFLTGETRWEELTPACEGARSFPAPRMLARLKGEGLQPVNLLVGASEKKAKIKPLDGSFAVFRQDGFALLSASVSSMYHHSTEKPGKNGTLYVEESLDGACVYKGAVTVPGDLVSTVLNLLKTADFRFGRSRSAQYGACALYGEPSVTPFKVEMMETQQDEPVCAVLLSDLVLMEGSLCTPESAAVRTAISAAAGLKDESPVDPETDTLLQDSCAYRELGGYQAMWQLRKNVLTAVRAGSYYLFISPGGSIPRELCLGEYPQEGLGRIRLIPWSEMSRLVNLREEPTDRPETLAEASEEMLCALLVCSAEEAMERRALQYAGAHADLKNRIQVGRLRLMLAEARDLRDLVLRVQSIKTNTKRKESLQLLRNLYSDLIRTDYDPKKEDNPPTPSMLPEIGNMLHGEETLIRKLQENPEAQKRIRAEWKRLLSRILSLAYYQEGKEEA